MVNYIESLRHLANDDFNISYTYGSKASRLLHPASSFTAAVQDVKDGLVDFGVGPFWVFGERLEMTSFTLPIGKPLTRINIIPTMLGIFPTKSHSTEYCHFSL